jgi:tyrosyl-tRNA synthetase
VRLIAVCRYFDVVDHAIEGILLATRSDAKSRYRVQRDVAAKGPVGRESLALPRMASETRTELLARPSGDASPPEAAAWLTRNAVDCLPDGELERKLELGRPLRVKLGIDPTAPDIHLGFTVVLQKLREFQDLGHTVVLIIGDYTARVGDPSGRSATRPVLSPAEIDANAQTFQEQALKVLDPERLEVRFNGEWLDMSMEELFRLARIPTVAQLLERDDFAKRFAAHQPISVLELLYPLLQGYDSVAVRADVELGGTDQKFNLLLGRDIQRAYGVPEQVILTMPLLTGTDGSAKMSKSAGNYIGVTDPPGEMYGKTLSIPDASLAAWYELLLGAELSDDIAARDAKRALARDLVARFHGPAAAAEAEAEFDRVHIQRQAPEEMPTVVWASDAGDVHLPALLAQAFGISTSEARRTLAQGGVRLDGEPVPGGVLDLPAADVDGKVLQLGKRRFARVVVAPHGA